MRSQNRPRERMGESLMFVVDSSTHPLTQVVLTS